MFEVYGLWFWEFGVARVILVASSQHEIAKTTKMRRAYFDRVQNLPVSFLSVFAGRPAPTHPAPDPRPGGSGGSLPRLAPLISAMFDVVFAYLILRLVHYLSTTCTLLVTAGRIYRILAINT